MLEGAATLDNCLMAIRDLNEAPPTDENLTELANKLRGAAAGAIAQVHLAEKMAQYEADKERKANILQAAEGLKQAATEVMGAGKAVIAGGDRDPLKAAVAQTRRANIKVIQAATPHPYHQMVEVQAEIERGIENLKKAVRVSPPKTKKRNSSLTFR
jgi:hypothetical protein